MQIHTDFAVFSRDFLCFKSTMDLVDVSRNAAILETCSGGFCMKDDADVTKFESW